VRSLTNVSATAPCFDSTAAACAVIGLPTPNVINSTVSNSRVGSQIRLRHAPSMGLSRQAEGRDEFQEFATVDRDRIAAILMNNNLLIYQKTDP
jgi:hypothetical protein